MSIRHASKSVVDGLSLSRSPNYVCRQCRRNAHPLQIATQQRQFASERSENLPFAEKVRRKLWKGKPPGPENVDDLYGGPGVLETMYKERRERRARGKPSASSAHVPGDAPTESQASTAPSKVDQNIVPEQASGERTLAPPKQFQATRSTRKETVQANPEYKPATSWEGLTVIGSSGHWKEEPVLAIDDYFHWLESPVRPEWSYDELVSLMHQAIAEVHAYRKTRKGSWQLFKLTAKGAIPVSNLERATFKISDKGRNITDVEGTGLIREVYSKHDNYRWRPTPDFSVKYTFQEEEEIRARTQPVMTPLQPRLLYTPTDTTFLDARLPINAPSTIFIVKRFSYLTNHPIPDPILSDLASSDPTRNTIRTLLTSMTQKVKSKPAKVAEKLLQDKTLAEQSNLLVLGRRETPVDKEKEVGRWKVIEQELRDRGLPVLGKLAVQR